MGIWIGAYHIRIVSDRSTVVDIPSAHATGKALDFV
jgi:hypothetical protein